MLQTLPIALAQVKAGNTSENLLNEIRRFIYSLYRAREITKKNTWQYIEGIIQKWVLYLGILKIVKHLNLKDYYSNLQKK